MGIPNCQNLGILIYRLHTLGILSSCNNEDIDEGVPSLEISTETLEIAKEGGNATFVAGYKVRFLPGLTSAVGSFLHGYISTNGQYCPSPMAPLAIMDPAESQVRTPALPFFTLYPNPVTGNFTIEVLVVDIATSHPKISKFTSMSEPLGLIFKNRLSTLRYIGLSIAKNLKVSVSFHRSNRAN